MFAPPIPKMTLWQRIKYLGYWKWYWKYIFSFKKISFPLIRATYPDLVAKELCSVQPMKAATGLYFKLAVPQFDRRFNIKKFMRLYRFHCSS